jgi:hypothetical protein
VASARKPSTVIFTSVCWSGTSIRGAAALGDEPASLIASGRIGPGRVACAAPDSMQTTATQGHGRIATFMGSLSTNLAPRSKSSPHRRRSRPSVPVVRIDERYGVVMATPEHRVAAHLGLAASDYDAQIRRYTPRYDEMIDTVVAIIAGLKAPYVIDLGAGTGALGGAILDRVPQARVRFLDIDPEMLAVAGARVAAHGARAELWRGSFDDALPACDAVVASLALHHVPERDRKRALYCWSPTSRCTRPGSPTTTCTANGSRAWGATASPSPRPGRCSRSGRARIATTRSPPSWRCSARQVLPSPSASGSTVRRRCSAASADRGELTRADPAPRAPASPTSTVDRAA